MPGFAPRASTVAVPGSPMANRLPTKMKPSPTGGVVQERGPRDEQHDGPRKHWAQAELELGLRPELGAKSLSDALSERVAAREMLEGDAELELEAREPPALASSRPRAVSKDRRGNAPP